MTYRRVKDNTRKSRPSNVRVITLDGQSRIIVFVFGIVTMPMPIIKLIITEKVTKNPA